jgi:FAD/FMN-containing dehydrogenase
LRYGMTRQSILGLEAVLADGSVISRMGSALKDNAGYDLKHHFIGSEGTLGIVTRARLGLVPLSSSRHTAVVALQTFAQVQALLGLCRNSLGGQLSSFEVMWRDYFTLATQVIHAERPLFSQPAEFWVLIETMGTDMVQDMALLEQTLAQVLAWDDALEVVLAQSLADAQRLWAVREAAGEAARAIAPWAGFDVSMPTAEMPGWADAIRRETRALGVPQTQTYGHLGDGNLHLVVGPIPAQAGLKDDLVRRVHASVGALGGSISGEHGIGFSKKSHLGMTRSAEEIAMMRTLKHALDPLNLLNRGRIFDMP